jgi:hypothetical protein
MSNNKEIEKESSIEEFKDDYIPEIQVIDNEPSEYKYLDVVDKTRNLIDELNSKGYKVKKEEYDMDKEYQIIIRIEK